MFSSLRTVEFLKGKFELDNQNKNSFFFHLETIFIFFKLSDFFSHDILNSSMHLIVTSYLILVAKMSPVYIIYIRLLKTEI